MLSPEQQLIFERYKHPLFAGSVGESNLRAEGSNPSCGDEVIFTLQVGDGQIRGICHQTRGCAICTAATDLLAERLLRSPLSTVGELTEEEVVEELGIPLSPVRRRCATLPLEILRKALTNPPLPDPSS